MSVNMCGTINRTQKDISERNCSATKIRQKFNALYQGIIYNFLIMLIVVDNEISLVVEK